MLDYDWTLPVTNFLGGIELSGFFSAQAARANAILNIGRLEY
jgi:hypothetical protein